MSSYPWIVVMGTSAGGVAALAKVFETLPADFEPAIAVVHHLPASAKVNFQMVFGKGRREMIEAEDKMPIQPGFVYFAPPGYHLLIERDRRFSLNVDEPVCFSRPSIDVLFTSAAESLGQQTIGVLMTGANDDGARGLKCIADNGGRTIVQNPETAETSFMPQAALALFKPDEVLNLEEIGPRLGLWAKEFGRG